MFSMRFGDLNLRSSAMQGTVRLCANNSAVGPMCISHPTKAFNSFGVMFSTIKLRLVALMDIFPPPFFKVSNAVAAIRVTCLPGSGR